MNWKSVVFWILVFVGLAYFFFSFASFLFDRQEEMQLFIPQWSLIREMLFVPGGICNVLGLTSTQYYCIPVVAAVINSALVSAIGYGFYNLLQAITPRGYHLIVALFPVMGLVKVHIDSAYVADGTIALLCMLLFLCAVIHISKPNTLLIYSIGSAVLLYLIAGQLVLPYSILLAAFTFLLRKEKPAYTLLSVCIGITLVYIDRHFLLNTPLAEGLQPRAYHYTQILPDSFMYYIWLRFSLLLLLLFAACKGMQYIRWEKRLKKVILTGVIGIIFFIYTGYCLPNAYDVQNRMTDQLSYLSRRQLWDPIIQMHSGKKLPGFVNRNYLNMALAQKGMLGNKLFSFDQQGPLGLLSPYNGTYYMSTLLSDIHFYIGDLSTSESYAMEALTLARRGGSPRALQRLIQINLLKKEQAVVEKYLSLLEQMPCYKAWARQYRTYLSDPGKLSETNLLTGKKTVDPSDDTLLSLLTIDRLWTIQLEDSTATNRIAMEYMGCSYLLAKEMKSFETFFLQTAGDPKWQPLPLHFQEAAVMLDLNPEAITPPVRQRYDAYRKAVAEAKRTSDTAKLRQFGNTFWFYFQFKELNSKQSSDANTQQSIYE